MRPRPAARRSGHPLPLNLNPLDCDTQVSGSENSEGKVRKALILIGLAVATLGFGTAMGFGLPAPEDWRDVICG